MIAGKVLGLARSMVAKPTPTPSAPPAPTDPARQRLIDDIAAYLRERGIPAMVVYLPSRDSLLAKDPSPRFLPMVQSFAQQLGATFVDGRDVWTGLGDRDVRASFFPYDGHWNQRGSDMFAARMVGPLLEMAATPAASGRRPTSLAR